MRRKGLVLVGLIFALVFTVISDIQASDYNWPCMPYCSWWCRSAGYGGECPITPGMLPDEECQERAVRACIDECCHIADIP